MEKVRVARAGMMLKAMPPSSAAMFMHSPRKPCGPSSRQRTPRSSRAMAARASAVSGLGTLSARDECPPGEVALMRAA
jgi:hypothetical protein